MKEALTRSLTGALFVAVIVLSLLIHEWLYLSLFCLISILAWVEYVNLFPVAMRSGLKISGAILNVSVFVSVFFIASYRVNHLIFILPVFILTVIVLQDQINRIQLWKQRLFIIFSGMLYLALPLSLLHIMAWGLDKGGNYSYRWILYTLIFLWTYDTMAYVSGRLAGRHTIWKRISPRKTWEGAIGGVVFVLGLAFIMSGLVYDLSFLEWCWFGLIAAVTGTIGDFFESWLKRKAGLKDSGKILPGHGGVLDRFDSLLFSTPFITLYLYLVL